MATTPGVAVVATKTYESADALLAELHGKRYRIKTFSENDPSQNGVLIEYPDDGKTLAILATVHPDSVRTHGLKRDFMHKGVYANVQIRKVSASAIQELQRLVVPDVRAQSVPTQTQPTSISAERVFELIRAGIEKSASDIHIELRDTGVDAPLVRVRMRAHGSLQRHYELRDHAEFLAHDTMIAALYQNDLISPRGTRTDTIFTRTKRQEAMCKISVVHNVELRFASYPEQGGYDVILRIVGHDLRRSTNSTLAGLGMSELQERDLLRASQAPHGLILCVGATGAGKTRTINTLLSLDPHAAYKKRISLEIPPEAGIPYLSQIPVTEERLTDFIEVVMRSDPDVINAGEVRSKKTANSAQDAAMTGHLTFATFHANGILTALRRAISSNIGFDLDVLCMDSFLRAIIYQVLAGTLCEKCKQPAVKHMASDRLDLLTKKFEIDIDKCFVQNRQGCSHCKDTGVTGRIGLFEVLVPNRQILQLINARKMTEAWDAYREMRRHPYDHPDTLGKTYVEHGIYRASQGTICTDDLFKLDNLWTYEVMPMSKGRAA